MHLECVRRSTLSAFLRSDSHEHRSVWRYGSCSNRVLKLGAWTKRSYRVLKQGAQAGRSNRVLKQSAQTCRANKALTTGRSNKTFLSGVQEGPSTWITTPRKPPGCGLKPKPNHPRPHLNPPPRGGPRRHAASTPSVYCSHQCCICRLDMSFAAWGSGVWFMTQYKQGVM